MQVFRKMVIIATVGVALGGVIAACSAPAPTATNAPPTAIPTATSVAANPFASVAAIVDPTNHGWPRQVKSGDGIVTIQSKPSRVHTISLGHDEITYGLVPPERIVAVAKYTQDPQYSNVAGLAKGAATVGREPEQIIAQRPDVVIASRLTKPDFMQALRNAGITVVQSDLDNTMENRVRDILLLGYILGEEARATELAAEVQGRHASLQAAVRAIPASARPRVLPLTSYSDKIYTAGRNSTEGSIVDAAGGINVAAEAGLDRNPTISTEGIISMHPDIIVIPEPEDAAAPFKKQLLANPALADVPAIKQGRIYILPPRLYTTLSFWNVRGAEELAKTLFPDRFAGSAYAPFSLPSAGARQAG